MQAVKSANDSPQLAGRPSPRLRSTGSRSESRIDRVNLMHKALNRQARERDGKGCTYVYREIDRLVTDGLVNFLDDTVSACTKTRQRQSD